MILPDYTIYATPIDAPSWEIRALETGLEFGRDPFDFSCIFKQIEDRVLEVRLAQIGPKPQMREKLLAKATELNADFVQFVHKGRPFRFRTDRRQATEQP